MTLRLSTGLRNAMLNTGLDTAFDNGSFVDIYSGAQPATADTAPSGVLLASVAMPADAFQDAGVGPNGQLTLQGTWQAASAAATGTAGWARMRTSGDAGGASTTLKRLDGAVTATGGGGEFQLSTVSINAGQQVTLTSGSITQPAQ